jgi:hypothetical protein
MKVLHLRAMAMCLWVPYLHWVTLGGRVPFGSGTKLFEKVPCFLAGVPELKTILKVPGFQIF